MIISDIQLSYNETSCFMKLENLIFINLGNINSYRETVLEGFF